MTKKEIDKIKNGKKVHLFTMEIGRRELENGTVVEVSLNNVEEYMHEFHKHRYVIHCVPDLMHRKAYIQIRGRRK